MLPATGPQSTRDNATTVASTDTQTKYPIVLVHGFFGFDNIGPVEYFYGIPSALRAEQLLTQVKQILAATGSNKGTAVADVILKVAPSGSLSNAAIASITNGFTSLINWVSNGGGLSQNSSAGLVSVSTAGAAAFNQKFPAGVPTTACGEGAYTVNGISYFSWSGAKQYTNLLDPLDPVLVLTGLAFGGAKNDGLVASCASHLGKVIRDDYAMNHLDEINQTVGLVNIFETNPVTVYRQQANRLKNMGL